MSAAAQQALRFAGFSAVGWAGETLKRADGTPARSIVFGYRPVPLLPIYGAGAVVASLLYRGPLRGKPWYARAAAYGLTLSAVEWLSCQLSRALYGTVSWSYDGCVDLPHTVLWGAAALGVEPLL